MADNYKTPSEISWTAPEFESLDRGALWYLISLLIALALLGFSLWQGNFLFAVFVVVVEVVLLFFSQDNPREVSFKVSNSGLFIDKGITPWSSFHSFSISASDSEGFQDLVFQKEKSVSLDLKVRVKEADVDKIRNFLHNYLPEVEHQDSLIDSLAKLLKL